LALTQTLLRDTVCLAALLLPEFRVQLGVAIDTEP
jgi:hypothetical protein